MKLKKKFTKVAEDIYIYIYNYINTRWWYTLQFSQFPSSAIVVEAKGEKTKEHSLF